MQRLESVLINDIAPNSRKMYNENMNGIEGKKEYSKPELEYVAFDYADVVLASGMDTPGGDIGGSDEGL